MYIHGRQEGNEEESTRATKYYRTCLYVYLHCFLSLTEFTNVVAAITLTYIYMLMRDAGGRKKEGSKVIHVQTKLSNTLKAVTFPKEK